MMRNVKVETRAPQSAHPSCRAGKAATARAAACPRLVATVTSLGPTRAVASTSGDGSTGLTYRRCVSRGQRRRPRRDAIDAGASASRDGRRAPPQPPCRGREKHAATPHWPRPPSRPGKPSAKWAVGGGTEECARPVLAARERPGSPLWAATPADELRVGATITVQPRPQAVRVYWYL